MGWRILVSLLFFVLTTFLLISYFLFLGNEFYITTPENTNFSSYISLSDVQFYPNLRFSDKEITYSISKDCPLIKRNHVEDAMAILENLTIISFNYLQTNGEIQVDCSYGDKEPDSSGFFIAGEGGPTNITITNNFNVIHNGKILVIRESKCPKPNVETHELLHALGFKHSTNSDSIMYEINKCSQVITDDIVAEINRLYLIQSFPDLAVENFSARSKGRSIDVSFNVINQGLKKAPRSEAILFINDKEFKRLSLKEIEIGYGVIMNLRDNYLQLSKIEKISIEIQTNFEELNKKNNKIELSVSY